ncbi:3-methyl-2-oxobutanoate hydroxymethyltransferase [Paucibacter sp. XJ19-41]|uniref:3-methyl-2-oxobutanoate hydroxymethyltransferase n=1 Tax=Paucibacter sp. XJ19-41 TaxID=2927824 RepID=UPI003FA76E64
MTGSVEMAYPATLRPPAPCGHSPIAQNMSTERKPLSLPRLQQMHADGEKIAMLTCYDAAFASLLDGAGVDILLIGDSLGNVLQGRGSTAPVSLEDMVYHTTCVRRGVKTAWVLADLPFDSYHVSKEEAWKSAAALVKAGAQMVKLEGGGWTVETVRFLSERGIPVCAHLGFTPQTVNALGGFKVQGRDEAGAARIKRESQELVEAGAAMLLYEMVPATLAAEITAASPVPVIGIGAGVGCSGQVLVLHDMLDITPGRRPRFVKNFMAGAASIQDAVGRYLAEVKAQTFPDNQLHSY